MLELGQRIFTMGSRVSLRTSHRTQVPLEDIQHYILCKHQVRFLHFAKIRLILNMIITGSLLVFLVINCASALFWHPRNICEQSPAPSCEAGEYLQSQFIASTNESEIMNCSPYSTFERKLWFDCVVSCFFKV